MQTSPPKQTGSSPLPEAGKGQTMSISTQEFAVITRFNQLVERFGVDATQVNATLRQEASHWKLVVDKVPTQAEDQMSKLYELAGFKKNEYFGGHELSSMELETIGQQLGDALDKAPKPRTLGS